MKTQSKNAAAIRKLLRALSRDPQLRRLIAKARRGKAGAKVDNVTDLYLLLLAIASRLSNKKKARALEEEIDVIYFLVQISLLLKENLFDRPEVRAFFGQRAKQLYRMAQQGMLWGAFLRNRETGSRNVRVAKWSQENL
jgi:hypothetical protein